MRRTLASRANGALSRGPVTEFGKQRSAANSLRHGLLAKNVVLANESPENFAKLLLGHIEVFEPANELELGALEEMTAASWRQKRAAAIETRLFDNAIAAQPEPAGGDERDRVVGAFTALSKCPEFEHVQRYETRLSRLHQRALKNLLILRLAAGQPDPDPDPPHGPASGAKLPNEPSPISGHLETGDDWPDAA